MPSNSSFLSKYRFWLHLVCALVLLQLPFISVPFKWLESYFHEISHGLAALISGGSIVQIQLFPNGAGLCTTRGGSNFLISFMGYTGAILWGSAIYALSAMHTRVAHGVSSLITVLLALSILLWVRDLLTLVILLSLLLLFIAKLKLSEVKSLQFIIQTTGLVVLLNSLLSPLYLLDGRDIGDGAALANQTFIPEIIWVAVWCLSAALVILLLARKRLDT